MVCKSFTQSVPFSTPIQGGLQDGMSITVNLQYGSDVILHFNPRYEGGSGFNVVVCNTYDDGTWGKEEQCGCMPFKRGQPLQVDVFSNGEKVHTYSHRYSNLENIDVLDIRGDVQLSFVQP
uniref:Galectin n=1 Tax=Sinocyclocheilus anshuiensis TaxID=1608454 RepID=A0A671MDC0_9TELE